MQISNLLNPLTSSERHSAAVSQTQQAPTQTPVEHQQTENSKVPVTNMSESSTNTNTTSTAGPTRYIIYGGPNLPGEPKTDPKAIPDIPEPPVFPNEDEVGCSIPPQFHESGPYELLDIRQVRTFYINRITNAPPALPDCDLHKDYLEPRTEGNEVQLMRIWADPPEAGKNRRVAWLEDLKVDILPRIGAWHVSRNKPGRTRFSLTRYAVMFAPRADRPLQWNWVTIKELREEMGEGWRQLVDEFREMTPSLIAAEKTVRQGVKRPREEPQPQASNDGSSTEVEDAAPRSEDDISGNDTEVDDQLNLSELSGADADGAPLSKRRKVTVKGKEKAEAADIPSSYHKGHHVGGESSAEAQLLAEEAQLLKESTNSSCSLSTLNTTHDDGSVSRHKPQESAAAEGSTAPQRKLPSPNVPKFTPINKALSIKKKKQLAQLVSLDIGSAGDHGVATVLSNHDIGHKPGLASKEPTPSPLNTMTRRNSPLAITLPELGPVPATQPDTASESPLSILSTPSSISISIKVTPSPPPAPPTVPPRRPCKPKATRNPRKFSPSPLNQTTPTPATVTGSVYVFSTGVICRRSARRGAQGTTEIPAALMNPLNMEARRVPLPSNKNSSKGKAPAGLQKQSRITTKPQTLPSNKTSPKGKAPAGLQKQSRITTNSQSPSKVTKPTKRASGGKRAGASSVNALVESLSSASSASSPPLAPKAIASETSDSATTVKITDEEAVNTLPAAVNAPLDHDQPAVAEPIATTTGSMAVEKRGRGRPKGSLGKKGLMKQRKLARKGAREQ